MRWEIRERPYDLYSVMAGSTLLVLVILIVPDISALRVILGLPFILFFPGYALISALYPEKKRYFDDKGDPISKKEWEQLREAEEEVEEEREDDRRDGKGLDGLERVALSLGLSIAITPLIGLVLNYTYDWDSEHLGIRLVPILVSQYTFIMITSVAAVIRRNRVPIEDRFEMIIDISIPEDYTTMDKVLTVGIVVMMILSVGLLVYIIVVPREGEAFTEFYVLGPGGMAEDYPRNMLIGEEKSIIIGVGNHEHRRMNYTLVMSVSSAANNRTVQTYDHVNVTTLLQPSMNITVGEGETVEMPCNFSLNETGHFKLKLYLFRGDEEYRDLHLWIKVFDEGYLLPLFDRGDAYIAGEGGDPSELEEETGSDRMLPITVGLVNEGQEDLLLNISFSIGGPTDWVRMEGDRPEGFFTGGVGLFFETIIPARSSSDIPVNLTFPEGGSTLEVEVYGGDGTIVFRHKVEAGAD